MSLATLARTHPRLIDGGIHLDRAPALGWLALQAVALAPTWLWMARRLRDGSDDPLGLLALAALAGLVLTLRRELRAAPRLGWLALAGLATLAATLLRTGLGALPALPPLAAALVAVLALACGLLAFLPRRVAGLPIAGLAVLALPLLDSWFANRFVQRIAHKALFALAMLLCIAWSAASALGYGLAQARLERDAHARLWRCFVAERGGAPKLRVCERIVDADGAAFTDTSAWYWAALSGRSMGPWQAVTLAQQVE